MNGGQLNYVTPVTDINNQTPQVEQDNLPPIILLSSLIKYLENKDNNYIQKYLRDSHGRTLHNTPLGQIYHALMTPFRGVQSITIRCNEIEIKEVSLDLAEQTSQVVNWAYNRRYRIVNGEYIPLAFNYITTHMFNVKTFVATIQVDKQEVVLTTMSVAGGEEIEIFELFSINKTLPHHTSDYTQVELKRYAKHPIFDLLEMSSEKKLVELSELYARLVIRKVWKAMGDYMKQKKLFPYYILALHVKKWFESAGVGPVQVISDTPNTQSKKYNDLIESFPHYWKKSPIAYQAPHYPLSHTGFVKKI